MSDPYAVELESILPRVRELRIYERLLTHHRNSDTRPTVEELEKRARERTERIIYLRPTDLLYGMRNCRKDFELVRSTFKLDEWTAETGELGSNGLVFRLSGPATLSELQYVIEELQDKSSGYVVLLDDDEDRFSDLPRYLTV